MNTATSTAVVPDTFERDGYAIFRNVVDSGERGVCQPGGGGFGTNVRVTPAEAATFMNDMQALSEATRLGIPVLYKSNARNHIDPQARAGINEASGAFSAFPKEAGIAAAALGEQAKNTGEATDGDMSVVEDFAAVMGDEWSSIGLRGMYGYMADLDVHVPPIEIDYAAPETLQASVTSRPASPAAGIDP